MLCVTVHNSTFKFNPSICPVYSVVFVFHFLVLKSAHMLPYLHTGTHQGLHKEHTPGQRRSVVVQKPFHTILQC